MGTDVRMAFASTNWWSDNLIAALRSVIKQDVGDDVVDDITYIGTTDNMPLHHHDSDYILVPAPKENRHVYLVDVPGRYFGQAYYSGNMPLYLDVACKIEGFFGMQDTTVYYGSEHTNQDGNVPLVRLSDSYRKELMELWHDYGPAPDLHDVAGAKIVHPLGHVTYVRCPHCGEAFGVDGHGDDAPRSRY